MISGDITIAFAPLLPWEVLAVLGLASLILLGFAAWTRSKGFPWRVLALGTLLAALANPSAVLEERQPQKDVALIVVDDSTSQAIGERRARTEAAFQRVQERLSGQKDLEVRVARVNTAGASPSGAEGTRLFDDIERALADVPRQRVSGVALITDGQVHDVPASPALANLVGPIHAIVTGNRNEGDRRLVVEQAPTYGIVGNPLSMRLRVEDPTGGTVDTATLKIRRDGRDMPSARIGVGRPEAVPFTLEHGGTTVFEIEVESGRQELTLENNRAVVIVNGVRDRLRVLLVTGDPNPGERVWRNILKSDPGVDLIHFTILRPPEAQDFTPVTELSLIAFPIRELFEVKLKEFDLIIFDRYRRRDVLPAGYLDNIARYVRGGGALLEAAGPAFSTPLSLFNSPLGDVLPGQPTGIVHEQGYRPRLTDAGHRHPVTAELPGSEGTEASWGRWFRQMDVQARSGTVLMDGANGSPLLLLDRVGEGRVAQLLSDQIWLWARGYEGGGPQAELLRRLAHWLMKEPELEENDLRATIQGNRLMVERRSLTPDDKPVSVTFPSGKTEPVKMTEGQGGRSNGVVEIEEPGLYQVGDGQRVALSAVGALNPKELADVRATEDLLKPVVAATEGGVLWLSESANFDVRRVKPDREAAGRNWIGFKANGDFVVTGVRQLPLLPALVVFLIALGASIFAWRREGR